MRRFWLPYRIGHGEPLVVPVERQLEPELGVGLEVVQPLEPLAVDWWQRRMGVLGVELVLLLALTLERHGPVGFRHLGSPLVRTPRSDGGYTWLRWSSPSPDREPGRGSR